MQQRLKPAARSARAQVIAAKLFNEFLVAVDDAQSAFDTGSDGKPLLRLLHRLKKAFVVLAVDAHGGSPLKEIGRRFCGS
jgi:hypothetical protein